MKEGDSIDQVTIYINVYHTGSFKTGIGTYTTVLECIKNNEPITRGYVGGIKSTSKNRAALISCIKAFDHMTKPCDIRVQMNSEYVTKAINDNQWQHWIDTGLNAKNKPAKNLDLWRQLSEHLTKHLTTFEYIEVNSYTDYMFSSMKKSKINYVEDGKEKSQ